MQLSKRMQAIAGFVSKGNRLADIGTDHGYIPIYLVKNKIIPSAIAMDINKGPLQKAKEHVHMHQLENQIQLRLSDGMHALKAGEADTILIAGMGGRLMERIITEGAHALTKDTELIVQPQSELGAFRHFIHHNHMKIVEEEMLIDENKFYVIMKVHFGNEAYQNECEYVYGHILLNKKDETLKQYIEKELAANEKILSNLLLCHSSNTMQRIDELKHDIAISKEALLYYEQNDSDYSRT